MATGGIANPPALHMPEGKAFELHFKLLNFQNQKTN
jgi:hypothetical protein